MQSDEELPNKLTPQNLQNIDDQFMKTYLQIPENLVDESVIVAKPYWSDNKEIDEYIIDTMKSIIMKHYPIEVLYLIKDAWLNGFQKYLQAQGMFINRDDIDNIINYIFKPEFAMFDEKQRQLYSIDEEVEFSTASPYQETSKRERSEWQGDSNFETQAAPKKPDVDESESESSDDEETSDLPIHLKIKPTVGKNPSSQTRQFFKHHGGYVGLWAYISSGFTILNIGRKLAEITGKGIGIVSSKIAGLFSNDPNFIELVNIITGIATIGYLSYTFYPTEAISTIAGPLMSGAIMTGTAITGIPFGITGVMAAHIVFGGAAAAFTISAYSNRMQKFYNKIRQTGVVKRTVGQGIIVLGATALALWTIHSVIPYYGEVVSLNQNNPPIIETLANTTHTELIPYVNQANEIWLKSKTTEHAIQQINNMNISVSGAAQLMQFSESHFNQLFAHNTTLISQLRTNVTNILDNAYSSVIRTMQTEENHIVLNYVKELASYATSTLSVSVQGRIRENVRAPLTSESLWGKIVEVASRPVQILTGAAQHVAAHGAEYVRTMTDDRVKQALRNATIPLMALPDVVKERFIKIASGESPGVTVERLSIAGKAIALPIRTFGKVITFTGIYSVLMALMLGMNYFVTKHYNDVSVNRLAFDTFAINGGASKDNIDSLFVLETLVNRQVGQDVFDSVDQSIKDQYFGKSNVNVLNELETLIQNEKRFNINDLKEYVEILRGTKAIPTNIKSADAKRIKTTMDTMLAFVTRLNTYVNSNSIDLTSNTLAQHELAKIGQNIKIVGGENKQFIIQYVPGDGACFFRAVANGKLFLTNGYIPPLMQSTEQDNMARQYREKVVEFARTNPNFQLTGGVSLKNTVLDDRNAKDYWDNENINKANRTWENYLDRIANLNQSIFGESEISVLAHTNILDAPIHIYNLGQTPDMSLDDILNTQNPMIFGSSNKEPIIIAWNGKVSNSGHYYVLYPVAMINQEKLQLFKNLNLEKILSFGKTVNVTLAGRSETQHTNCPELLAELNITDKRSYHKVIQTYHPDKVKEIGLPVNRAILEDITAIINSCWDKTTNTPSQGGGSNDDELGENARQVQNSLMYKMDALFKGM